MSQLLIRSTTRATRPLVQQTPRVGVPSSSKFCAARPEEQDETAWQRLPLMMAAVYVAAAINLCDVGAALARPTLQQRVQEIQAGLAPGEGFGPGGPTAKVLGHVQKAREELQRVRLLASAGQYQDARALVLTGTAKLLRMDLGYAPGVFANVLEQKKVMRTLDVYKRLESGLSRELPALECGKRVDLVEESLAEIELQLQLAGE